MTTFLGLMEKLAALVPIPRANLVRYHGVLAPASTWRAAVVPSPAEQSSPAHYGWAQYIGSQGTLSRGAAVLCLAPMASNLLYRGDGYQTQLLAGTSRGTTGEPSPDTEDRGQ